MLLFALGRLLVRKLINIRSRALYINAWQQVVILPKPAALVSEPKSIEPVSFWCALTVRAPSMVKAPKRTNQVLTQVPYCYSIDFLQLLQYPNSFTCHFTDLWACANQSHNTHEESKASSVVIYLRQLRRTLFATKYPVRAVAPNQLGIVRRVRICSSV